MHIPRGLFYESQLNQTLGGANVSGSTPLNRMTVQANQFAVSGTLTLDAYLNARPVQMVLSGNVTLDEAWWFVGELLINRSWQTTTFLLDITEEFYTMGFVNEVGDLVPNTAVTNAGNFSPPSPPPPPPWQTLWNAIAAVASAVPRGLVRFALSGGSSRSQEDSRRHVATDAV